MPQPKVFEDPERGTALTLRVIYDGHEGVVTVASAMHHLEDIPSRLSVIASVRLDKTGWWAVRNAISEELSAYALCEDHRSRAQTPF